MQPTYLPWSGYFNLASQVNTFVFLDDVQFERRSWQNRNRILIDGQEHLLTVPIKKTSRDTPINLIQLVDDVSWKKHHFKKIFSAYPSLSKNSYLYDNLLFHFEKKYTSLSELNINLIKIFFKILDINCEIVCASHLGCGANRSEHLALICKSIGADLYISPIGSKEYLLNDGFESLAKIPLKFQNFEVQRYFQNKSSNFVSHLSILDVIGNCGVEFAMDYVRASVV